MEDVKKRCILKEENGTGARVFYYDHPDTEYQDFNKETIRVYAHESDSQPFLRCHVSQMIEVPDSVMLDTVGSIAYPDSRWFHSIKKEWAERKAV